MFSAKDVQMLDTVSRQKLDLHFEKMIIPGFIGLNNIKANDYVNVVVQAISHIPTIRDYFLLGSNRFNPKFTHLVSTFGNLTAKIWNFHPFKNHVSPHELLQVRCGLVDFLDHFFGICEKVFSLQERRSLQVFGLVPQHFTGANLHRYQRYHLAHYFP